jgi:hypothetical protein
MYINSKTKSRRKNNKSQITNDPFDIIQGHSGFIEGIDI